MLSNFTQRGSIAAVLILIFIPIWVWLPYSYALIVTLLCLGLLAATLVYSRELLPLLVVTNNLKRVTAKDSERI